jgi:hypothetical protein
MFRRSLAISKAVEAAKGASHELSAVLKLNGALHIAF